MSYFRRPMGDDGPITHPWQVDDSLIANVPPTRVDCAALAADSPWRDPGQVCAPSLLDSAISMIKEVAGAPFTVTATDAKTGETSGFEIPSILLIAGAAAGGYYLFRRKR